MSARPIVFLALLFGAGSCALMGSFDGDYRLADSSADGGSDTTSSGMGGREDDDDGAGGKTPMGSGGDMDPPTCEETCPTGVCVEDECVPWSHTFSSGGLIRAVAVDTDRSGEVVVAGDFEVNALVGGQTISSQGMFDVFITRFRRNGEPMWTQAIGGPDFEELAGLAVDEDGDSYVAMRCSNVTITGIGPSGSETIGTGGGDDICIVRFGANGDVRWARSFGQGGWETVMDVAVGPEGLYLVGRYDGSIDFDGHYLAGGFQSGYIVGLDKITGQATWAVDVPSPTYAEVNAVVAKGDRIFVGGRYGSWTDIQGWMLNDDDGVEDLFIGSFNAKTGAAHWVKRLHNLPGGGWAYITDMAALGDDAVIVGTFQGPWDFGGPPQTSFNSQGFVARIGNAGQAWFHATEGPNYAELRGVDKGDFGDVVVTGQFFGLATFGGHAMTTDANTTGSFFSHIAVNGDVVGAEQLDGAGAEYIGRPAVHRDDGNLLFVGDFDGTLELADDSHVANGTDAFVVSHGAF